MNEHKIAFSLLILVLFILVCIANFKQEKSQKVKIHDSVYSVPCDGNKYTFQCSP